MLENYGVRIIIFDGKLNEQREFINYQGNYLKKLRELFGIEKSIDEARRLKNEVEKWRKFPGVYLPTNKIIMWKLGSWNQHPICPPPQHEYSHAIDWAAGKLLFGSGKKISNADEDFIKIYKQYKKKISNPRPKNEFFVDCVGAFYNSDLSIRWLKRNYTYGNDSSNISSSMYGFAKNLEKRLFEKK